MNKLTRSKQTKAPQHARTAASLAKKGLGLRTQYPSSRDIEQATERRMTLAQEHPSLCQVYKQFADVLNEHHLENLPSLPMSGATQNYAARYAMVCFRYKNKEYCREIKEETKDEGKKAVKTVKHWAKTSQGTQQPITAKEFEDAFERSKKPEQQPRKLLKSKA
jgi:hypothetical protein